MITTKNWPDEITPEIEKQILRHPAVRAMLDAIRSAPPDADIPPISFYHLIEDWEEQREIRRRAFLDLQDKANNPPRAHVARSNRCASLSSTCLALSLLLSFALIPLVAFYRNPFVIALDILPVPLLVYGVLHFKREAMEWAQPYDLESFSIEITATAQNGQADTIKLDIRIPKTTLPKASSELLFVIRSFIQARYNDYPTPPPISHFSPYFEQTVLKELQELRIPVFRYRLYNPVRPEANDGLSDDVPIGFEELNDGSEPPQPRPSTRRSVPLGSDGVRNASDKSK